MSSEVRADGTVETRQRRTRAGSPYVSTPLLCCGRIALLCYAVTLVLSQPAMAQRANPAAHEVRAAWFRVLAPVGAVPDKTYERLVRATRSQRSLPGLPRDVLQRQLVTISLALRMNADIVGWTSASDGLVVIRLSDAQEWDDQVLYRNLRHELAHIGLSRHLGDVSVPRWFSEGYSEFAAGGVSCEGEVRLALLFGLGQKNRHDVRTNDPFGEIADPRVAYDAFGSFFEFLEAKRRFSVASGLLFANVKRFGIEDGLRQTYGVGVKELERRWRSVAVKQYSSSLDSSTGRCIHP